MSQYETGAPCKNGHKALRWTANGKCVECRKTLRKREYAALRKSPALSPVVASRESKKLAKLQGLTRYITGFPCRNGHVAERMSSDGSCVECNKAKRKKPSERARKNRQKQRRRQLRKSTKPPISAQERLERKKAARRRKYHRTKHRPRDRLWFTRLGVWHHRFGLHSRPD